MNKQRILHGLGFLLAICLTGLADYLQHSAWALAPAMGAIVAALLVDLRKVFGGPPPGPPAVVALLAAVMSLGSFGCWLTKPPPISPTVPDGGFADASAGQTFVDCSESALHTAWVKLLPDVETAVALGPASVDAVVAQVAATVGVPLALAEAACGLQWLVARISHSQITAPDPLEATKLENAQAWLARHPAIQATNAGAP